MYCTYVLFSKDFNRFYTGMTNNLKRRLKEHNTRQNKSTKAYTPWEVVYMEEFETRVEARNKEKYLKTGVGREFINTILKRPRSSAE